VGRAGQSNGTIGGLQELDRGHLGARVDLGDGLDDNFIPETFVTTSICSLKLYSRPSTFSAERAASLETVTTTSESGDCEGFRLRDWWSLLRT
jgi:hypothetical protein